MEKKKWNAVRKYFIANGDAAAFTFGRMLGLEEKPLRRALAKYRKELLYSKQQRIRREHRPTLYGANEPINPETGRAMSWHMARELFGQKFYIQKCLAGAAM